ncbi:MAG: ATP synthase F0 subunit B [Syntrophobacteraceae bacterium]
MIDINLTLFIQMANFLVLLALMNLVLYKPIRRIVAQRKQLFIEQQEAVDKAQAEVVAVEQEFNGKILEARKLGRQRIQEFKATAYEQEKDLVQEAGKEAAKQLQDMRSAIQGDLAAARDQLKKQVKIFSTELAQKILGRTV